LPIYGFTAPAISQSLVGEFLMSIRNKSVSQIFNVFFLLAVQGMSTSKWLYISAFFHHAVTNLVTDAAFFFFYPEDSPKHRDRTPLVG
jgi:hypothetical protein